MPFVSGLTAVWACLKPVDDLVDDPGGGRRRRSLSLSNEPSGPVGDHPSYLPLFLKFFLPFLQALSRISSKTFRNLKVPRKFLVGDFLGTNSSLKCFR